MDGRRSAVLGVSIASFVLASLFVVLRFISLRFVVRRTALHDYLMLWAWLISFGFSFSLFYAIRKGLGLPAGEIEPKNGPALHRANYSFTVLYNPALMAVKSSILVFYLSVARNERLFRWATYITLGVVNGAGLGLTLVNVFQCSPISAAFSSKQPQSAHCIDTITLYLSSSPVNIVTDLAILVLPMPLLTKTRLPLKQKVILVVTFGVWIFVAIVDVIQIVFLQKTAISRQLALQSVDIQNLGIADSSWYASMSFMWSVVEVNMSIICGCVPNLRPIVARIVPKWINADGLSSHFSTHANSRRETRESSCTIRRPSVAAPSFPQSLQPSENRDAKLPGAGNITTPHAPVRSTLDADISTEEHLSHPRAESDVTNDARRDLNAAGFTFFGFFNVDFRTSMVKLNNKNSVQPVAVITLLFFLWGFAYGLLDVLNARFQSIARLNTWQSLGLHGAYFGGYAVGPLLIGRQVLKVWGFKTTFITGLCIYACGSLIFWPSAVLTSAAAYTASNFIVGMGLSILETAANPFISLCGPLENSEVRLNISQGVQAIGSVLSPLLAKKVLFNDVHDVAALVNVQWTFLAIALFDVLLAVVFYYLPLPEAPDKDLEELANSHRDVNLSTVAGIPVVWATVGLGIWSQFFYVAGQEVVATGIGRFTIYARSGPSPDSFDVLTVGHSVFAAGRFLTALTQLFIKPRWILLFSYVGMIVFSVLCMKTSGSAAIAMAMGVFLFESGAFSTIFALSLRGAGRHTKTAAAFLAASISGGVYFPFAQYSAFLARGEPYSFCVQLVVFGAGAIFPIYLNLIPAAKKQVDPFPDSPFLFRGHRPSDRARSIS